MFALVSSQNNTFQNKWHFPLSMDKFDANLVYVEQTGMVFVILISFSCDITQKDNFMNAAVTTLYFIGISRINCTTFVPIRL